MFEKTLQNLIKNNIAHTVFKNGILINDDCFNVLKLVDFDHVITDPPYNVTKNKWDLKIDFETFWKIIDKGSIIMFGQNKFTIKAIMSNFDNYKYSIVWNKMIPSGFLNANKMPLYVHEDIMVFNVNNYVFNPQKTKGLPNHGTGIGNNANNNYGKFTKTATYITEDKFPKTILEIPKIHSSKTKHPTEKPVELMTYLVKTFSNENQIILDCFCGIGTTAISCINENRFFICIEKDKNTMILLVKE